MKPLVTWSSQSEKLVYLGKIPKKPQRWRVLMRARAENVTAAAEFEIKPAAAVYLEALIRGTVVPAVDDLIAEAREAVNDTLGVADSSQMVTIHTAFEIFKWR